MTYVYSVINIAKQTFLVLRALNELWNVEKVIPDTEIIARYLEWKRPLVVPAYDEQVIRSELERLYRYGLVDRHMLGLTRKGEDFLREALGSGDPLLEGYQTWFTPPKEPEFSGYERFAT